MTTENTELAPIINNINQSKKLLDDKFQKKLIKVLVEDEAFAKEIIDLLKEEYFEGLLPVTTIGYILNYFEKYNTIPNYDTIEDLIRIKETDEITKNHLLEFIKITKEYKLTEKKHIINYTRDFCKKQSLRRGLEEAAKAWEKEEYESIHKIIMDSMKIGDYRERGHNYIEDIEKRLIKSVRNPVPFLDGFNYKIGGGLSSGELGIILASTGAGKSMMLVKGASNALLAGKTVIYYSMELPETTIANRFDSCFTGHKLNSILNFPQSIRDKMQEITSLGGKLIIKEYPTGTASVNTFRSHLKHLERDGIIPDIIFVDYADIMKATSAFSEKRFALTSIYEGLRALAMELHIPIWTASQASRCIEINTLVDTYNGKKKIKDIKINDEVLTKEGFKKVSHVFPIENQTCYKIKLKSGKEIIVSERHMFPIVSGDLKSIESGLSIGDKLFVKL